MPRMRHIYLLLWALMIGGVAVLPSAGQENLLSDPGFEGNYTGRGRADFNFPEAWGGWWIDQPRSTEWMNIEPIAYPHTGGFKRSGGKSQSISRGYGTFTAAVYQSVQNVPAGTQLRASVYYFLENVSESNSQVRIGIGNNTGGNPTAAGIVWSPWGTTVQSWNQVSVDAVATGGEVTVYIYATQTWPNDPNAVYLDDASLVAIGTGAVPTAASGGTTGGVVAAPTTPPLAGVSGPVAQFVRPQGASEDGTIVHVVQSGDTLAAISVAYGVPASEILALNGLSDGRLLQVGQRLVIQTPEAQPVAEEPIETEAPSSTGAETEVEVAQAPTAEPSATPSPEPTPIPATPTIPPTAPVVSAQTERQNPTNPEPRVCVLLYEDSNQNRILEGGETALAGGSIRIEDGNGAVVAERETTGEEPFCFDVLAPGDYTAIASAPDGYGLTTPARLLVRVRAGAGSNLSFGAAQGVAVAVAPTADAVVETPPTGSVSADDAGNPIENILAVSGLIVLGLAGIILVGGLGASVLMRRR